MADDVVWESWSPQNVPHVSGRYERRRWDASGLPLPQRVECECSVCRDRYVTQCTTGQVRVHISRFAMAHLHADPLGRRVVRT